MSAVAGLSIAAWLQIAQGAGQLAQKYGPAVANAIQQWWQGSEEQHDLGDLTLRVGQQLLIQVLNADYEVSICMPDYYTTTRMGLDMGHGPGSREDIVDYMDIGTSAIIVQSTNDNGPWNCNVLFNSQNGSVWAQPPILQIADGGNDNLWPNRRRIYLARLHVVP